MPKHMVVEPGQAAPPLAVVGEEITVLASGDRTGSYEIFSHRGPEGSGPPPHSHPWDEAFYVLEGSVHFGAGEDEELVANPGTLVHVPGGVTHWFRFGVDGGAMIAMTSRAGAAAFFNEVAREVSPTDPDLGVLVGIAVSHGLTVPVPG